MIRLQPREDNIDPIEDKKKARDAVLNNVTSFFILILVIRASKYPIVHPLLASVSCIFGEL